MMENEPKQVGSGTLDQCPNTLTIGFRPLVVWILVACETEYSFERLSLWIGQPSSYSSLYVS